MRDGLPVITLTISVVAFAVALAGVMTRGPSEISEPPEEMLGRATAQLLAIEESRKDVRKEFDRLRKDVVRVLEAGPASRGAAVDPARLRDMVKREVDTALRRRLGEETRKAGGAGKAPPKAAKADAAKLSAKLKEFNAMLAEMEKALKLDKTKSSRVRTVLTRVRNDLNNIFRDKRAGKMKGQERDSRAKASRGRADRQISGILGRATFDRFKAWRRASKNAYVKRFFGL